jgi:hypothetical protein
LLDYARDVLLPAAAVDPDLHRMASDALHHTLLLAYMARAAGEPEVAAEYLADTVAELTHILAERGLLLPPQ